MQISYLVNQYPKVSHSFIRREILGLEDQGFKVQRIALRGWLDSVVDPIDKAEKNKTTYILQSGKGALLLLALSELFLNFRGIFKALLMAKKVSRMSERRFPYHFIYLLEAIKLKSICEQQNSQHLHCHFGTNSAEVAMLCKMIGGPSYSFTVHGPEEFDKPLSLHLKEKVALASFVAAISSYGRSQLYRWADYDDWHKIKIVHCGLDDYFFQSPERLNYQPEEDVTTSLLCIGRLCEQKGQLLLIKALRKVVDAGFKVHLTLAGDGEMRSEIEQLVSELDLSSSIAITGWISSAEVKSLLNDTDAMILASFAEGLPVAIMEAMAQQIPVISTYIAGIPELVKHKETGWLCQAGDIDALAATIIDFINTSPEQTKAIVEAGFSSVYQQHNIRTETAKLAKYFEQVISQQV